ncbi:MAG: hypothetical protein KVP17_000693 [Porospora cf. gigantea B]|uniref:uncharacterized protein n=1 Tax=Porospora cf. gigantea B TaxID=2853592 RepID=UPI0035719AB6|nr:MAG: hypothetical protein KVP17_000693 [Porospora cf. gigantea B]
MPRRDNSDESSLVDPAIARRDEKTPLVFRILAVVIGITSICLFVAIGLRMWRVNGPITIFWLFKGTKLGTPYAEAQYGLFLVSLNGGSPVLTWSRLSTVTCTTVSLLPPAANGIASPHCGEDCIGSLQSRCAAYRQMSSIGNLMLVAIVTAASISLVGAGWLWIFGASNQLPALSWTISGVGLMLALVYYAYISFEQMSTMAVRGSFVVPTLGTAFWLAFSCTVILIIAGLGLVVYTKWLQYQEWQARKKALIDEIAEEQGFDALDAPPPAQREIPLTPIRPGSRPRGVGARPPRGPPVYRAP